MPKVSAICPAWVRVSASFGVGAGVWSDVLVDGWTTGFCWLMSVAEIFFVVPVRGAALFALMESLILAQDERWRRA